MPVVSKKQGKFMQAVANSPKFAKKVGVKQSIGREFTKEKDMNKNYMKGGKIKKMNMGGRAMKDRDGSVAMDPRMQMAMAAQQKQAAMGGMKKGGKVKKMREGGNTSKMNELEELGRVDAEKGYSAKGKKNLKDEKARVVREIKNKKAGGKVGYKAGGKVKKMNMGGMADKTGRALAMDKKNMTAAQMSDARGRAMKAGGAIMKAKGKAMKKGGAVKSSASKRADGIAQRGHTRGRHV